MSESLTDQQKIFVAEYLKDRNGTRAAVAAGYSEDSARSLASQLLTNVNIRAAVDKGLTKIANKLEISAEKVLQELAKMAFVDARNFWNADGSLKAIVDLDENTAAALAGFETEEAYEHFGKGQAKPTGVIKKIKIADKGINLERLGRHLKLFTDKLEVSGMDQIAEQLAKARARSTESQS